MTAARGIRYEVDRMDGDTLLFKNGTWFRAHNDFDYGWCYQYPSMAYAKVRRNDFKLLRDRGFYALMMVMWAVGLPAIAWSLVFSSGWWLLYAVPLTVFSWVLGQRFHRDLFKYMWHGYLTLR